MKRVLPVLVSCIAILFLWSCKAVPATTPTTTVPTVPTSAPTKTIYIPVSEYWTFVDGSTSTVNYVYDENNRLLEIQRGQDHEGNDIVCTVTCDEHGWVLKIDHAGLALFQDAEYTYDEYGRVKTYELTNTNNSFLEYTYDSEGRLIKVERPLYNGSDYMGTSVSEYIYSDGLLTQQVEYDRLGNKLHWVVFEYDNQGRLIKQTQNSEGCVPAVIHYCYSEDGLTCTKTYDDSTEVTVYDANGNLIRLEYFSSVISHKCEYTYKAIEVPADSQWIPYVDHAMH